MACANQFSSYQRYDVSPVFSAEPVEALMGSLAHGIGLDQHVDLVLFDFKAYVFPLLPPWEGAWTLFRVPSTFQQRICKPG